jgi:membrane protein implicated in regulation of membrane protease activity
MVAGASRLLEENTTVSEASLVGCVGSLIVATRGDAGAGEVLLTVRGSKEAYLAWSDRPLPKGTKVLVVDTRGARAVVVDPWPGLDG